MHASTVQVCGICDAAAFAKDVKPDGVDHSDDGSETGAEDEDEVTVVYEEEEDGTGEDDRTGSTTPSSLHHDSSASAVGNPAVLCKTASMTLEDDAGAGAATCVVDVLTPADVYDQVVTLVKTVAAMTGFSLDISHVLLLDYKLDIAQLRRDFHDKFDLLNGRLKAACNYRVLAPRPFRCTCDAAAKCEEYFEFPCGHRYCFGILEQHIAHFITRVDFGNWHGLIGCPEPKCSAQCSFSSVTGRIAPLHRNILRRGVVVSIVHSSRHYRRCPNTTCELFFFKARVSACDGAASVTCACGERLCFTCGQEEHLPATCGMVQSWTATADITGERYQGIVENGMQTFCRYVQTADFMPYTDGEASRLSDEWVRKFTKACSSCGTAVAKAGGCNHMTCRCGHEWCWTCSTPWFGHVCDSRAVPALPVLGATAVPNAVTLPPAFPRRRISGDEVHIEAFGDDVKSLPYDVRERLLARAHFEVQRQNIAVESQLYAQKCSKFTAMRVGAMVLRQLRTAMQWSVVAESELKQLRFTSLHDPVNEVTIMSLQALQQFSEEILVQLSSSLDAANVDLSEVSWRTHVAEQHAAKLRSTLIER